MSQGHTACSMSVNEELGLNVVFSGNSSFSYSTMHVVPDVPSFLSALQPFVSLGLLNNQSPLLSVFRLLCPLLYLHYFHHLFHLFLILPRLIVGFRNKLFFRCEVVSPTPNPQPGGPGYPFSSGSSPLTCLAWEALPVA